ncbi:MAG TPA: thioredoxin domain-containing protein [Acidimicrobiales bacterium]|nr:thioredoxin domain-containing protein [Acidimicrobiales bacterium]
MNRLASETSPYLRQHADNPVDWYPWGAEALTAARELDRPVMLSVGYSSCHWCHVMAHESFEDFETAAQLNSRFVPVKVDREERPDVDAIYMEAVQAVSGRGGWPMTVFLTPDGRPFFAGTYFPVRDLPGVPGFRRVLEAVDDAWRNRRGEVEKQADALLEAISHHTRLPAPSVEEGETRAYALVVAAARQLEARFDPEWGGFGPAPKFPHPTLVDLCLLHHRLSDEDSSKQMAEQTLGAMAAGGIYDQLGGGFHRYSTDETWTVPHFEKMLYDQAGLVRTYLHAWQVTKDPRWLGVVTETVGYVLRDLSLPGGGVCSAEDADSEGTEGRFYVWTKSEIVDVLGADLAAAASQWYGVTDAGNFDGRCILRRPLGGPLERPAEIERARRLLLAARGERVRPGRDDKVLTEWNAMFGSALAEAAGATGRDDWGSAAVSIAEFLLSELRRRGDGRWLRSWQDGRAQHLAYASDHAWLIELFTRLAELTGEYVWLERARQTAEVMLELFSEPGRPLYTTGTDAEQLVVRPVELTDGATPSATSVAAAALLRLGALCGDVELTARGESLLEAQMPLAAAQPLAVAGAVTSATMGGDGILEVVVGWDRRDLLGTVRARYEPNAVLAWGQRTDSVLWEGRTEALAYVCRRYACQTPSSTAEELEERLDTERALDRSRFFAARGT